MRNSKGKLFGVFNIIDILIIIIIAVIIGGGIYAYKEYQESLSTNIKTVEYSVEIKGVDEKFVNAINNGDLIRESVKGNSLGSVSGKSFVPSTNIYSDYLNGKYVVSQVPGKLDLILTLTSDAQVTDRSVSVGGLEIRIGQKIYVKGKGYAGEGFVINMNIKE
ncbi:MAG: hypothetical protein K0R84_2524 [Clostridia bacterium]|nr:hypothetical protein [Clostridia bacterium]